MSEENKALLRRFIEEVANKGNLAVIDEIISADVVDHNPQPGQPSGREGVKQNFNMFRTAFPDLHITIDDMVAEGDKVAARMTMRGTHRGELMGIPPTGKQVVFSSIEIDRFSGGQCVDHWEQADIMGLMQQLGVAPGPGDG